MTKLVVTAHKFRQIATTKRLPVDVSVSLNLGKVKPRTRQTIAKALLRGVYWGDSGTQWLYVLLAKAYDIPWITVAKRRASKNVPSYWLVFYNKQPGSKLVEVFTADRVANKLYPVTYWSPDGKEVVHHVQDKQMFDEAGAERVKGYEEKIVQVVADINAGVVIPIEHEPIPTRYAKK